MQCIASFDVDPQKTFTPLCPKELPVPEGDQIVDALNAQAELANLRILSRDAHPANPEWLARSAKEFLAPIKAPNMDRRWYAHAVVGTRGFELLDGLPHPVNGYAFTVSKGLDPDVHPYGACYHDMQETQSTGVIEFLKANGVTDVVIGGLALDHCVYSTALQLRELGFRVIINLSACRGISQQDSQKAMEDMQCCGIDIAEDIDAVKRLLGRPA